MADTARSVSAAWQHRDARAGFEVVFLHAGGQGRRAEGSTTAVEDAEPWIVSYEIELATDWTTRRAVVASRSRHGRRQVCLEADGAGSWLVNGAAAPEIDGCLDVDLESSALTNAFPVRRLRLEQRYVRLSHAGGGQRYRYGAPAFDFECVLTYGADGLVAHYPGIAVRVA